MWILKEKHRKPAWVNVRFPVFLCKNKNAKKLLTANVQVKFEEDKWIVLSEGAKRASDHFNIKEDAIARAKEIAENKKTGVEVFKKDGSHQKDYDFSE